jgi:hypothetical protein
MSNLAKLAAQRERRKLNGNSDTKKYEKTPSGFLMRLYRNMKSRIKGIQYKKAHLYEGKELLSREDFYTWAKTHPIFLTMFSVYSESGFSQKLAPTVDREDSTKGYSLDNMRWLTHSENSRLGALSRHAKSSTNLNYS